MSRVWVVLGLLAAGALGACDKAGDAGDIAQETKTGTDTQKGSAGGFSAGLSADLAKASPGSGRSPATPEPAGSGSAPAPAAAGSGSGSAAPIVAEAGSGSAKAPETGPIIETPAPRPVVEMTAEMKAIKLSLQPNWDRDKVGAGTISLEVNVQSRDVKALFKFNYGYDDPKAPTDREAYKKFLADSKQMTVTTDRQRGAAWYLEGTDPAGRGMFRLIVIYGGKRLICGGSTYKESDLGDIRDEVVIQAKKICETIAL